MPRSFKNTKKPNHNKKKLISQILKQKKKYGGSHHVPADGSPGASTAFGNGLSPGPVSSSILGYNIYERNDSYILVPVYNKNEFKHTYTIRNHVLDTTQSLQEYTEELRGTSEPIKYKIGDKFDFQVSEYEDGIFEVKVTEISGDSNARDIMQEITTELTNCDLKITRLKSEHEKEIESMQEEKIKAEEQRRQKEKQSNQAISILTSEHEASLKKKDEEIQVKDQEIKQRQEQLDYKELMVKTAEEGISTIESKLKESFNKQKQDISTLQQENKQLKTQLQDQGIRLPPPQIISGNVNGLMQSFQNIFQKGRGYLRGGSDFFGGTNPPPAPGTSLDQQPTPPLENQNENGHETTLDNISILYNAVTFALLKYKSFLNDGLFIKLRYVYTLPDYKDIFQKVYDAMSVEKKFDIRVQDIIESIRFFLIYTYPYVEKNTLDTEKYTELGYDAFEVLILKDKIGNGNGTKTENIVGLQDEKGNNTDNVVILCEDANELLVKYMEGNIWDGNDEAKSSVIEDLHFIYWYITRLINRCEYIYTILSYLQDAKGDIIRVIDSHLDDKIITYVKFRHGQSEQDQINQRNIFFYMKDKGIDYDEDGGFATQKLPLYLLTRNDTKKYYDNEGKLIENDGKTIQRTPFTDLYSFGPFHKIFEGSTNEAVGKNMSEVMTKLEKKENVFVMGYGASGAGKTSTLIEFQPPGQDVPTPGALVYTLDNLAETYQMTNASLQVTELFQGGTIEKFEAPIDIIYKEKKWKVDSQGNYNSIDTRTIAGYEVTDFLPHDVTNIEAGSLVSTILSQLVNKSRLSRGTVNNPQSSRSHIMIDIHFKDGPHLFVGDFAGVEQKFNFEYISRREDKLYNSIRGLLTAISIVFQTKIVLLKQNFINELLTFENIHIDNDNIYKYIEYLFALAQIEDNGKLGKLELNPEIMSLIKLKYQKSDRESFAYPYSEIIEKNIDKSILNHRYDFIKKKYKLPESLSYSYDSTIQDIEGEFAVIYNKNYMNQDTEKKLEVYANELGMDESVYLIVTVKINVERIRPNGYGVKVIHKNTIYEIKNNKKSLKLKEIAGENIKTTNSNYTIFGEDIFKGKLGVSLTRMLDTRSNFDVQFRYYAGLSQGQLYEIDMNHFGKAKHMSIEDKELAENRSKRELSKIRETPSGEAKKLFIPDKKLAENRSKNQKAFIDTYKKFLSDKRLKGTDDLIGTRIKQVLNSNVYNDFLNPLIRKYNTLVDDLKTQKTTGEQQSQKLKTSFKNISKLLYYVQYLQNEIINRTYEGVFINDSLSRFRSGMANNLKLKQMQTLYTGSSLVTARTDEEEKRQDLDKNRIYREKILSKLIPGSTDQYCGHTYGDIPLSNHFDEREIDYKTSDIIHDLIQESIQKTTIRGGSASTELAPKPIDVNYCLMLVINNSKEANDPPRTAFIDTNILKREFNRFSTRNLPSNKNFLFLKWEMHDNVKEEFYKHSFIRDINIYRSKTVDISILKEYETQIKKFGFGNGITKEITTSLLDDIGNIQEINSKGLTDEHERNKVSTELNSLILKLDSLNAPSLIGTLVFADEMSKYSLSHYTCHHKIMHFDRIKTQPYELYKILEEQTASNMASIKHLFGLHSNLIKKSITSLNGNTYPVPPPGATVLGGKLLKNVSAKYKKTKRGKRLIKQSKKKNKNT